MCRLQGVECRTPVPEGTGSNPTATRFSCEFYIPPCCLTSKAQRKHLQKLVSQLMLNKYILNKVLNQVIRAFLLVRVSL